MDIILLILLIIVIILLIILISKKNLFNRENELLKIDNKLMEFGKDISQNLDKNRKELEYTKNIINQQTLKTYDLLKNLNITIEQLSLQQKSTMQLAEDLKYLFQKPKSRGNFTEIIFEDMLKNILPESNWQKQYKLNDGIVDFIIKYNDRIIPIDVKLPLDDYNKYLSSENKSEKQDYWKKFQKRIIEMMNSISKKYICPEKGTSEFAIMFVPNDGIYTELISSATVEGFENKISDNMIKTNVMLAGPSSINAFLHIILTGLKNVKIYKEALDILKKIKDIQKDFEYFSNQYIKTGDFLNKSLEAYDKSQRHFERLKKKTEHIINLKDD